MAQPSNFVPLYLAPDLDPAWSKNPGLLVDAGDVVPSKRGTLKSWQCATDVGVTGFSEATYGKALKGAILKRIDGSARLFIGTKGRLLEGSIASGFLDRSKSGNYSANTSDWQFTSFGNVAIATNKYNAPQMSIGSGPFVDLTGSPPKAQLCCTQNNFVMLANYDDGTNNYQDGWWCSALGNYAYWTPGIAYNCYNGRLLDTPGGIRALVPLRDGIVAYKDDSIYVGSFQGPPFGWAWRLVSDRVGCSSSSGVASTGDAHYFLHRTGIYKFDGFSGEPIGSPIDRFLFSKMVSVTNYATVQAAADEYEDTVFWFFKEEDAADASNLTLGLCYNTVSGQFGFIRYGWPTKYDNSVMRGVIPCSLADLSQWESGLGTLTNNILTFGSDTTINLRRPKFGEVTAGAVTNYPYIRTGDIGGEVANTRVTRFKPRFIACNAANLREMYGYTKYSESDSYGTGTTFTADATQRRWDGVVSGRLVQMYGELANQFELAGVTITSVQSGSE